MFLSGFVFVIPHLVFCNIVWIISKMADDLLHNYMSMKKVETHVYGQNIYHACVSLTYLHWNEAETYHTEINQEEVIIWPHYMCEHKRNDIL